VSPQAVFVAYPQPRRGIDATCADCGKHSPSTDLLTPFYEGRDGALRCSDCASITRLPDAREGEHRG
jgi:hypothetical protein